MTPNIFDIATKELNQDAFITWLLQYADSECKQSDELLNNCGKAFVSELIRKQIPDFSDEIVKVKAGRQWENIDIWAKVNDKYLIIIEDKVFSQRHSDQLVRYKKIAEEWCLNNKFNPPICIYLKTGNESKGSLIHIINDGFSIFNRIDFINLLVNFSSIQNNIYIDFLSRLNRMEKSNYEFENKVIGEWNGEDWQGFFQYLENEIEIVSWHYVNNPNGGFWNAVLNWECWDIYPVYIQIEQGKLCFKIATDPDELDEELPENFIRSEVRNEFSELILESSTLRGLNEIRRPDRFGNGKYMTVAIVDISDWLGNNNDTINKELVKQRLIEYKAFLIDTIRL